MKIINLLWGFVKGKGRGVFKLLLTNSSIVRKYLRSSKDTGSSSLYCYGVWMKNLKYWSEINDKVPKVIVEIGPGNSLGAGLSALISGSQTYFALEKTQFWNIENNIKIFDELVVFFKTNKKSKSIDVEEVLDNKEEQLDFPSHILTEEHLSKCLDDKRLMAIRQELFNPSNSNNKYIHSIIPWNSQEIIDDNSVDYIFSHTVLQHLDNLPFAYKVMSVWLKKTGSISHKIDFKCMNRTKLWNGHWTLSKFEWKMITGGISLINREPLSAHLKLLEENNFEIKYQKSDLSINTLTSRDLSDDYKCLDNRDLTTSGFYYFAQIK